MFYTTFLERKYLKMEDHQKINCTVSSCLYNGKATKECLLTNIIVKPCEDCHSETSSETVCGSYKAKH